VTFKPIVFPQNFLWGAATAGHQVEGNNHNDWTEWEKSKARLAYLESSGLAAKYGLQNFISGIACDHYNRFKEDFQLAEQLGHNATRFSVEWSRIEPREGEFDGKAIAHYADVAKYLEDLGIKAFVTLWHWPVPIWLRDKGGWCDKRTAQHFVRYCEIIANALKPAVKNWITLNEPEVYAACSYLAGIWPPQRRNPILYLQVLRNLIAAHRKAYDSIKATGDDAQIGIAKANIYFEAYQNKKINTLMKTCMDWWWNSYFLDEISDFQDFIGLNFYMRRLINYGPYQRSR
jgi:beta-glucosidase